MHFEMLDLLKIPISLFNALIFAVFFSGFLMRKYKSRIVYIVAYTAYFLANITVSIFIPELIIIVSVPVCLSFPILLYSGMITQRLISGGLLLAYSFVSECFTMVATSFLFNYTVEEIRLDTTAYYVGAYISVVLFLGFVFMVTKRRNTKLSTLPNNYYIALLLIVFICAGLSYNDIQKLEQSGNSASLEYLLSEAAVATLSVLVFIVFESYQKHAEQKEHSALLERQIWQEEQRFKLVDKQNREIAVIKHDMINHLTSLSKLLSDGQYKDAKDYVDEYFIQVSPVLTRSITGKASIDALIAEKMVVAEGEGINFTIESDKLFEINISPYHLNIILSNAIDNALEACQALPKENERYISLGLKTEGDNLCIRVINSALKPEFSADGLPITSKKDRFHHGLGLSSVKRVAESYNGSVLCTYENNEFILYVQVMNKSISSPDLLN